MSTTKGARTTNAMLKTARMNICRAIIRNGPYSHNIIGLVLRGVSQKVGYDAANGLIDEFSLHRHGYSKEKKPAEARKGGTT